MRLIPTYHGRPVSGQSILFGVAAAVSGLLISIAIVQHKVLLLGGVAAVAIAIVFPVEVSLGAFAVLVPFDQVLMLASSGATVTWVAGAFAGVTLLLYGLVRKRFQSPPRGAFYWGLFVVWTAASIMWAIDPAISLQWLPTVATLFALYLIIVSLRLTPPELSRICMLTVVGGAAAAAIIIFQFASHISYEGRATLMLGNLEANSNELSYSLLLPFSLALGAFLSRGQLLKRAALSIALVLMTVCILRTISRGCLLALCATVLVYLLRAGVSRRILITILLLAFPLLFMPDLFYQRLKEAPAGRGTGRYDIWLAGLEIVKRYPVIGTGLANFSVAYRTVAGYAHVFHGYVRVAHNTFLEVCGETGIIGIGLFIAAVHLQMKAVRRAFESRRSGDYLGIAIEAACWGQLVMGLSGNVHWTKSFWLAFSLLSVMTQTKPESASNVPAWDPST